MNGMQEEINMCLEEIDLQKLEIDQMVKEANELRGNIAEMKKNMGFDDELFDDLDEFDKKVSLLFGVEKKTRAIVRVASFDIICKSYHFS
jgi:hypothetical protein